MPDDFDADIDALLNSGALNDGVFDPTDRDAPMSATNGPTVNWRTLSAGNAHHAWQELRGWVEWFVVRYNIAQTNVPDCWWRHGALVEELSALHAAHTAAFDPSDSGFGPIGWHERLAVARTRWKETYSGECRVGHVPASTRTVPVTDEDAWIAWSAEPHGDLY